MEIKVELFVSLIVVLALIILVVIVLIYRYCVRPRSKKKQRYTKLQSTGSTKLSRYPKILPSLQPTIVTNRTRNERAEQTSCSKNNHNKLTQIVETECNSVESSRREFETSIYRNYQKDAGLITNENKGRSRAEPIYNSEYMTSPDKRVCNKSPPPMSAQFVTFYPQSEEKVPSTY